MRPRRGVGIDEAPAVCGHRHIQRHGYLRRDVRQPAHDLIHDLAAGGGLRVQARPFREELLGAVVVDGQADVVFIRHRVLRQQIGRGDVHRHHALRHIALRRPQGRGVRLVGAGDLRIGQQIRSLAHAPQGAAQGGGAAHGVAVGTDVGQYQHLVQRPQEVCRLLYGQAGAHSRSSGSTMSALAGLAGFTWFRRSRMCAPWAMESSMKNCSSGV